MKKILTWYFNLCRQDSLAFRKAERLNPRFWHKDYIVLKFINDNIKDTVKSFKLSNLKVLDLGSSHKPYEELLEASEYFGVDISDNTEVDLKADLNNPLNLNRQFDLVVSFDTFEHVLNTQSIIESLHTNLKSGGHAIVTTPFLFSIHDAPYDYHRFTEYFYKDFPHQGFETISIARSTTYPASLMIHKSYFFYRLPIPYFLKFPFYFVNNFWALVVDWIFRKIAKAKIQWLQEFIWSGPLEYFVVLKKK